VSAEGCDVDVQAENQGMTHHSSEAASGSLSRRRFMMMTSAASALAAGGAMNFLESAARGNPRQAGRAKGRLKMGVIGCGGRGTGAAANALEASPEVEIHALADMFPERIASCRGALIAPDTPGHDRVHVDPERCFTGFDCYKELLETDVDMVIIAGPPHFRPIHLAAAVERGTHVFMEKPAGVDAPGIRSVLASADVADKKGLSIVAGTQRRHETSYVEAMKRVRDGAIGRITAAHCAWMQGGLWMHERKPEWSDMEWQLRNWLYFTWLSGDHIVEQHVHNLDVINWALGSHPMKATGMGGRQMRTSPAYGHVFDHFAIEYEYPEGVMVTSLSRQIDGCASRVNETLLGSSGTCSTAPGQGVISGDMTWRFNGENNNPYVQEQADLIRAILKNEPVNEARQVAESTLTAIMGRMSAYTGKEVTWEQAMNSSLDLSPPKYELGPLPLPEVAAPGRTPLI